MPPLFFISKTRYAYSMMPLIIATVAEKGAGKGFFIDLVREIMPEKKIAAVRFSDIWREILHTLNKEESRENISNLATAVRQVFRDDGILVPAMAQRIAKIQADIIILDGVRKKEEIDPLVQKHNGLLVYIAASPKVRFQRRRTHAETTDEIDMSWEQFMRQERIATEISIKKIGETMTDAMIENNGTAEEFRRKIAQFLETRIRPILDGKI